MAALQIHALDEFSYRQSLIKFLKQHENPALAGVPDPANSIAGGLPPHYEEQNRVRSYNNTSHQVYAEPHTSTAIFIPVRLLFQIRTATRTTR